MSTLWSSVIRFIKHSFLTLAVLLPVGITVADEIGTPATVNGVSMRPSFNPTRSKQKRRYCCNDIVWVSSWNIRHRSLQLKPGDVIAIQSPIDARNLLIKRVVGVPGEQIRTPRYHRETVTVPPNHYWVEGDNSRKSEDSNHFGPVSHGLVVGVVTHILWPPHRWQRIGKNNQENPQ